MNIDETALYDYTHIRDVINSTSDEIIERAQLPENGVSDAFNFLIAATLYRLQDPTRSLEKVAKGYELRGYGKKEKKLSGTRALKRIFGWMHE